MTGIDERAFQNSVQNSGLGEWLTSDEAVKAFAGEARGFAIGHPTWTGWEESAAVIRRGLAAAVAAALATHGRPDRPLPARPTEVGAAAFATEADYADYRAMCDYADELEALIRGSGGDDTGELLRAALVLAEFATWPDKRRSADEMQAVIDARDFVSAAASTQEGTRA